MLFLYLCSINVLANEAPAASEAITLPPEQVFEGYKELKGKWVHTVIWLDDYTWGTPYGRERENSKKEIFSLHLAQKSKPEVDQYIEILSTIGGKTFGFLSLDNTEIISEGDIAKAALAQIDGDVVKGDISADTPDQTVESQIGEETQNLTTQQKHFDNNLELITANGHPKLYDLEEEAKDFYSSAPEGTVAITTWSESLTDYFDHNPDYTVLWLDGYPLDLGKENERVGFVTLNYTNFDEPIDIETAISYAETFIPEEIYRANGNRENYISTSEDTSEDKRICWVIHYDTVSLFSERGDLSILFYGKSDDEICKSVTSFSEKGLPREPYVLANKDGEDGTVQVKGEFELLSLGDSGDRVAEIQKLLIEQGYLTTFADGDYGPITEQAVIDFQKAVGLSESGIVDGETYSKLIEQTVDTGTVKEATPEAATSKAATLETTAPEVDVVETVAPETVNPVHMYAVTDNINIRSGPSTDSDIVGMLAFGDPVLAESYNSEWLSVTTLSGTGYVASQFLSDSIPEPSEESTPPTAVSVLNEEDIVNVDKPAPVSPKKYTTTSILNVRTSPSTDGGKIGEIQAYESVDVYAIENGWAEIEFDRSRAYVSADYISEGIIEAPVRSTPAASQEQMVWIPTNGGRKYHRSSSCSNMIDPEYVTVSEATSRGFTPCGKCY